MLKLCEQVATGVSALGAYRVAYPHSPWANGVAHTLLKHPDVQAEILRLRAQAQQMGGPAFLTLVEKRMFLARVVRAQVALLPHDSDLWQRMHRLPRGTFYGLPDKLDAIIADNELSIDDSKEQDALTELLISVRQ
jgi:hypothetical protein